MSLRAPPGATVKAHASFRFADRFDERFGDLDIGREPTPERGFLDDHGAFFAEPEATRTAILSAETATDAFAALGNAVGASGHPLFLLVDEYDNFTNELVATGQERTYEELVRGSEIVRTFFKAVKEATGSGLLARCFLTGVNPLQLNDLKLVGRDAGLTSVAEFVEALSWMMAEGHGEPFFRLAVDLVLSKLSNRDLLKWGGASIKAILLSFLSLSIDVSVFSEWETNRGYADLVLIPSPHATWLTHAWRVELKYLKQGEDSPLAREKAMAIASTERQASPWPHPWFDRGSAQPYAVLDPYSWKNHDDDGFQNSTCSHECVRPGDQFMRRALLPRRLYLHQGG